VSDTVAVVDTCCLVNLCAVDEPSRLLPQFGITWHVPRTVVDEGLYIRVEADGVPAPKRKIELTSSFEDRSIFACDILGLEEASLYVELSRALDDGEAMGLAIAKVRGWVLATDDRHGRKRAADLSVEVITTPQLMRRWAELNTVSEQHLAGALLRIQKLARFVPAADFPEYDWWSRAIGDLGRS